jgi:hypothetical protein
MLDEELRDQLTDWARSAQRLPVPGIAALRGRTRRHRRVRAAGAAAGLAAAGVAAGIAAALLPAAAGQQKVAPPAALQHKHHDTTPARTTYPVAWHPAGRLPHAGAGPQAAPYFVTVRFQQAPADVVVTNWMTGKTVGTVSAPPGIGRQTAPNGFVGVAAAGDDRTFVLADDGGQDPGGGMVFYELRLGAGGRPLPLTKLAVPAAIGGQATAFVLSPDGRQLAVETARPAGIAVVSLATGHFREWHARNSWQLGAVSWAGNRDLAVTWYASPSSDPGIRLLDVAAGGSDLGAAPVVVAQSVDFAGFTGTGAAWDPLVSADGTTVFTVLAAGPEGARRAEIVQFSLLTGQPVRAVLPATGESGMGTWCGALWTDPSGQQVAAECGPSEQGVVSNGQLSQLDLHVPMGGPTFPRQDFAW